ncbi:dnaJ homolog subfamily C member 24-like [Amphiura filiformis]|uniref:dnaJ homolog subfamily C member 24-like n=1 Tax=Amphiura filiformis TaxID=82378 RepID=UPI003B217643
MASDAGSSQDLYAILGVHPNATQEEIKKCYQKKILQYHPDKIDPHSSADVKQHAMTIYSVIDKAWQVLSNPTTKKEYDSRVKEEKLNATLPVYDTVPLDDLDWDEESDCYCYPCRCGGEYAITEADVDEQIELVCCDTCTLGLRVIYSEESLTRKSEVDTGS